MKTNYVILYILAVFFLIAAGIYALWSFLSLEDGVAFGSPEMYDVEGIWVGLVALVLSAALAAFIAFFVQRTNKQAGGELPEDSATADIDDGEAEQGFFSPWSWWPIVLAGSIALVFLGLAAGVWFSFFAAPLVLVSIVGWVFEYYRGYFAH